MVMLAVPLLALVVAQADAAIAAPNNCKFAQTVPEGGEYLLPTRFEALIPSNTSLWVREAIGAPHTYSVVDQTANRPVDVEVTRTGLVDSVLVRLAPKADLERNHRISITNEVSTVSLGTFTVNMGVDVVAPAVPQAIVVPASQALQPSCVTSGYEVRAPDALETRILIVRESGEDVAASVVSTFFVGSPDAQPKSVEVVSVDLAGNYSDRNVEVAVTPDYPTVTNRPASNTATLNACTCTRMGAGPSLLVWSLLGLFFLRRK